MRRLSHETVSDLTKDELILIFERCVGKVAEGTQKFAAFLRHHGINVKRYRYGNKFGYAFRVEWRVSLEDRQFLNDALEPVKRSENIKRVK